MTPMPIRGADRSYWRDRRNHGFYESISQLEEPSGKKDIHFFEVGEFLSRVREAL